MKFWQIKRQIGKDNRKREVPLVYGGYLVAHRIDKHGERESSGLSLRGRMQYKMNKKSGSVTRIGKTR